RQGQSGVDDVLDDEHVTAGDVDLEVLENPHDPRGVGSRAVARDRHEVDLARHGELAHEVRDEEDRALEDAHEQQVASLVVGRDLGAELIDAGAQDVLVDQDLADVRVDGRHPCPRSARTAPSQPGASSRPTTATTAPSAVATSGQASRSSLGTLASTSTSGTLRERPARRSPGRRDRTTRPARSVSSLHGPQLTTPSSRSVSYARTARTPPPRSAARVPSREESSSTSDASSARGRRGRSLASASRLARARGSSSSRRASSRSRIRPRFVSAFVASTRHERPLTRQYASVSSRQTPSSGRTTPSA